MAPEQKQVDSLSLGVFLALQIASQAQINNFRFDWFIDVRKRLEDLASSWPCFHHPLAVQDQAQRHSMELRRTAARQVLNVLEAEVRYADHYLHSIWLNLYFNFIAQIRVYRFEDKRPKRVLRN